MHIVLIVSILIGAYGACISRDKRRLDEMKSRSQTNMSTYLDELIEAKIELAKLKFASIEYWLFWNTADLDDDVNCKEAERQPRWNYVVDYMG